VRIGLAGGAALIGVVGWWAARAKVAAIERNPDPYPRDQLAREPEGEEVLISRADGTVESRIVAELTPGNIVTTPRTDIMYEDHGGQGRWWPRVPSIASTSVATALHASAPRHRV
jgi:hypothetical protein